VNFMEDQFIETWQTHSRINLYLLDAIAAEALTGVSASKGRSVGEQFAHIHNVRLMWLQSAAPELLEGLAKIEKKEATDKALLRHSLEESGRPSRLCSEKGLRLAPVAKSRASNPMRSLFSAISSPTSHITMARLGSS